MKVKFDELTENINENIGSFIICDDLDNPIFHFLSQIDDKVKLKKTLKKYLEETIAREEKKVKIKAEIESLIASLQIWEKTPTQYGNCLL